VHPELFELKALVAGRLDAHRRREIDDHLGSCADCSRHYVALMLGSSSPKTAEAEAREGLAPAGGTVLTLAGSGSQAVVEVYGIDKPLGPSAPKPPARQFPSQAPALETEFPAPSSRTQVPVSASLVDVIAKLRAEAEAPKAAPATPVAQTPPAPVATVVVAPPVAELPLIEPSIFLPTPAGGVSLIRPEDAPVVTKATPELPAFMTRAGSASPSASVEAQPELVVTFSSTPPRSSSHRSPASVATVTPSADRAYVSQAVPNLTSQSASDYAITETTVGHKPKPAMLGAILGGVAVVLVLGFSGYKYFQSSVSKAASAAAAAATQQVQATAAKTPAPAPAVVAPAPAPAVQTRIVYVERPARKSAEPTKSAAPAPSATQASVTPAIVSIPDVNVSTGNADAAIQSNTQRSATSELTRSARATSTRTAAPRP
jgi:hypothetical protein